jgi:glycosyltransferase involved in cell wall biosynthesis
VTRPDRPSRIDQVLHILAAHDAIGAHVIHNREALRALGVQSDIFAGDAHPEVRHLAKSLDDLPITGGRDHWLWFHHSTGSAVAEAVLRRPEPIVIDYHNVTPADYVRRWAPWVREELELGAEQLRMLAPASFFGVAHSRFSEHELHEAGCAHTRVVAPLFDLDGPPAPDPVALAALDARRSGGGADWVFVGRISPHKAQHDLVKALACYRQCYDPSARLHLVGTALGIDYRRALERFAVRLGLRDAVHFAGVVSDAVLAAYYRSADVFVCVSDHEGFCVPLVEAMHRGLPVIAYGTAAVGETVGDGGLVLADKEPMTVAAAVHRVIQDRALRRTLVEAGRRRARQFSLARGRAGIAEALAAATAAHAEEAVR